MAVRSINPLRMNLNAFKRLSNRLSIRSSARYSLNVLMVVSTLILLTFFSGCHSFSALKTRSVWMIPNLNTHSEDMSGIASVHCLGGLGCQFVGLNNIELLNSKGEPTEHGKTDAVLRFESRSLNHSSQYYLALTAAPHDVEVLFFPISRDRAEKFTVTHRFKAGHRYDFQLYRQEREQSASLLSLAGPAPLCVDVHDDDKVVRRFCRNYGFQTMTTSFVEQKI